MDPLNCALAVAFGLAFLAVLAFVVVSVVRRGPPPGDSPADADVSGWGTGR